MTGGPTLEGLNPEQRFRRLYGDYHLEIHAYLRRRTDPDTAVDALADAFLVVWRRIDKVPSGDGARPWIYGVARKTLANLQRGQRRSRALYTKLANSGPEPSPDPAVLVVRSAEAWEVIDAMGRLRDDDREVLQLAAWEDLPHADIAAILGCSTHAVDQRLLRAKDRLEREMRKAKHRRLRSTTTRTRPVGGSL